ncbi:hypothetical protein JCM30471_24030 [Desulfuromonas carbonis]|uniref:tol-pal system YbgF family protein n=1 Tax=Desulfuromonas sp. DDH964 TaxID=1823759 RepID=UPI000829590F|nr:tetratricopeptide repeat protein [Desulfuromonas sp. DDH964]
MEIRKLQKKILREELRRRRKNSKRHRLLVTGILALLILLFAGAAFYLYNLDGMLEKDFQQAQELVEEGDYATAVAAFQRIYQHHPSFYLAPQALFEAGEVLNLYQQRYPEALLTYLLVEKDFPDSESASSARRKIAEIYKYRLRDYSRAVVAYQKLLDSGVEDGDRVQYELGDTYFRLNNFEQARIEFESLFKTWPQSPLLPQVRFRIATTFALEGELKEAEADYRAVIREWPDDPFAIEARFGLAAVLEDGERLLDALKVLEQLRGVYPNPEILQKRIEQVKERIRKKKKAI